VRHLKAVISHELDRLFDLSIASTRERESGRVRASPGPGPAKRDILQERNSGEDQRKGRLDINGYLPRGYQTTPRTHIQESPVIP
jgi:hypothetical protein